MTDSYPEAVLAEQYPERQLVDIEPVSTGNRRQTVVAWFAGSRPVVLQWSEASEALRVEAALTGAIRARTTVPVPETLSVGNHDGVGYVLREHRAGSDLHQVFTAFDAAARQRLVTAFGRYLAELHTAFQFDGMGPVTTISKPPERRAAADESGGLTATGSDGWLVGYGRAAVERLPPAFDPLREGLEDCLESAVPGTDRSRLFPWDLRPGNALVAGSDITAVVDWEGALAAPPALAVAKAAYLTAEWYDVDTRRLRRAFREGYETVRQWPAVTAVHRVIAIADSAVDSRGQVTTPGYPEYQRAEAVAFHREALIRALAD